MRKKYAQLAIFWIISITGPSHFKKNLFFSESISEIAKGKINEFNHSYYKTIQT